MADRGPVRGPGNVEAAVVRLTLHPPLEIGPRLLPAVSFDGGRVSLDPSDWTYHIDLDDGTTCTGHGFRPPQILATDDVFVREAMAALLGFLGAFAEARRPNGYGPDAECWDLFPDELGEWAYLNSDEIAITEHELTEDE